MADGSDYVEIFMLLVFVFGLILLAVGLVPPLLDQAGVDEYDTYNTTRKNVSASLSYGYQYDVSGEDNINRVRTAAYMWGVGA